MSKPRKCLSRQKNTATRSSLGMLKSCLRSSPTTISPVSSCPQASRFQKRRRSETCASKKQKNRSDDLLLRRRARFRICAEPLSRRLFAGLLQATDQEGGEGGRLY